jgi:hypothetical protein
MQLALMAGNKVGAYFVLLFWDERQERIPASAFDAKSIALEIKGGVCTVI